MTYNLFAIDTIKYIWSHPNCKDKKTQSVLKFFGWQLYKRITHRYLDIEILPGVKIRCHPDSTSAGAALYCGLYDYNEMNFLLKYLRTEDSFLDIGANVGVYTLLAASKIKSGTIFSFEALPKNYTRLEENLKINQFQQVKPYAIAVSDFTGSTSLSLAEGDCMPFITLTPNPSYTITVPTDTLDHLLPVESISNLTLAKIDIEGAEILALKGATTLLKQQRPHVWIMELNDTVNNFGHRKQDVVKFLQDSGYGLYKYNADTNQIYSIQIEQYQGNNILAIANTALDFVRQRLSEASPSKLYSSHHQAFT